MQPDSGIARPGVIHVPEVRFDNRALSPIGRQLPARAGGDARIGGTKRSRDTNLAVVDRHGLRLAVSTLAMNHPLTLVQLSFDFYLIEEKSDTLIGDKAYDSDRLEDGLHEQGIAMITPHR